MRRIKRIRSYAGLARWLTEVEGPIAWLARCQVEEIPSPYSSGPSVGVYSWRHGLCDVETVVYFETSHRCYDVFRVPKDLLRFATDDEATEWHVRFRRAAVG